MKKLIVSLDEEKRILKEEGITVDGIIYEKGTQGRKGSFVLVVVSSLVSSSLSFMITLWEI